MVLTQTEKQLLDGLTRFKLEELISLHSHHMSIFYAAMEHCFTNYELMREDPELLKKMKVFAKYLAWLGEGQEHYRGRIGDDMIKKWLQEEEEKE